MSEPAQAASDTSPPRRRRALQRILFLCVILLVCLVVGELGLRALYFHQHNNRSLALTYFYRKLEQNLAGSPDTIRKIGIWEADPILGYRHKPGSVGQHITADFSVTYTIGPEGERSLPAPAAARGDVLVLGGSCAFGHGVEADETFAALLARTIWRDWRVVNLAVSGWGSAHCLLKLRERLRSPTPPALVLYAFIPDHVRRNGIRGPWVDAVGSYGYSHPHFELQDGALVYQGLVTTGGGLRPFRSAGRTRSPADPGHDPGDAPGMPGAAGPLRHGHPAVGKE